MGGAPSRLAHKMGGCGSRAANPSHAEEVTRCRLAGVFGRVAEVAETQVLEARLACEGRLWMNHRKKNEVWTLLD